MAGNVGASFTRSFTIDTHSPSLTITSDVAPVGSAGAVITFTFTEYPGASFGDDDLVVIGGTLGAISGTGLTRTAIFTPASSVAAGTATISVAAGRYTDAALNPGDQASLSLATDTLAPDASSAPDLIAASDRGSVPLVAVFDGNAVLRRGTPAAYSRFLGFANNHSIHHRGQLAAYLRAMGSKVPNIYGPSADAE